jgi:hypothetical protein
MGRLALVVIDEAVLDRAGTEVQLAIGGNGLHGSHLG